MVPAELCRPLARLAIIGARMRAERDAGCWHRRGRVTAELAIAADGASRTRPSTALGSWLSARDASEVSGVSWQRLRGLAAGRLIARKFGDRWMYDAGSQPRIPEGTGCLRYRR